MANDIIELTDDMLIRAGRKVQKKGAVMFKINVLHLDRKAKMEAKENAHYDRIIKAEVMGMIILTLAYAAFELAF